MAELEPVLRRRRFQRDHWDNVIVGYREVERAMWQDPLNEQAISEVRGHIASTGVVPHITQGLAASAEAVAGAGAAVEDGCEEAVDSRAAGGGGSSVPAMPGSLAPGSGWLPVHVIDLEAAGVISPHIDSVKFSGGVVCGISLLSHAYMTLQHEDEAHADATVDLYLPRRSLYILSGAARYHFTHAIKEGAKSEAGAAGSAGGDEEGEAVRFEERSRRVSLIFRDEKVPD